MRPQLPTERSKGAPLLAVDNISSPALSMFTPDR